MSGNDLCGPSPVARRFQWPGGISASLRGNLRGDPNYMICSNDSDVNPIRMLPRLDGMERALVVDAAAEIDRLRAWLSFIAKVDDHAVQALNGAPSPLEDDE